jgi:predicted dehydrogenase
MTATPAACIEDTALVDAKSDNASTADRPRLGFLGVGWIGRNRLEAIVADGCAEVVAVADSDAAVAARAGKSAPGAAATHTLDRLFDFDLDGLVIATPSALHAAQALSALQRGLAVFCQKPLARTAHESARIVEAARVADRLLGVDLSYRYTSAMRCVRDVVSAGEVGEIYSADLVFHNAYGPDKPWFRDPALSGGGCVIDLGIHLVDLALWTLGFPRVMRVSSRLYAQGKPLRPRPSIVEDYATAELELETGAVVRLACSWNLPVGCDAVIEATFHGTRGGTSFRNVNGSFYDFVAERYAGTRRTRLAEPPDAWGGRAAVAWARQLACAQRYDPAIEQSIEVSGVLDRIYGR